MGMFDNTGAFEPFYDTFVAYRGDRVNASVSGTFRACVIDGGYEEVFDDSVDTSSRIRKLSVRIPRHGDNGWVDSRTAPQIGDVITLTNGIEFAVRAVDVLNDDEYVMEARQK